jgi:hypothetical protein
MCEPHGAEDSLRGRGRARPARLSSRSLIAVRSRDIPPAAQPISSQAPVVSLGSIEARDGR